MAEKQSIENTLEERKSRYGIFTEHARITQDLKRAMQTTPNWVLLTPDKKECLEMIAHKIGRILNGDPNYLDSWHDIIGYAKLIENNLAIIKMDVNQPPSATEEPLFLPEIIYTITHYEAFPCLVKAHSFAEAYKIASNYSPLLRIMSVGIASPEDRIAFKDNCINFEIV